MNRTLLFYINSLRRGGAERVMLELAARFAADGWRSVLVTSYTAPDEYPVPPGVERLTLEEEMLIHPSPRQNLERIRKLRRLCREYGPATLIAFMPAPCLRAVLATRGLPVKVLVSVRNEPEREYAGRVMRFVGRHILPLADGCVFQTAGARAWFPEKLRRKSTVIMNQVAQAFFDEAPAAEHRGVVAVGRLNEQKNHALLLRAYAALGDTEDALTIYGEGPLRDTLEAQVRQLGLAGRVFLPGQSADIPGAIKGAKLFVLPSSYEGMPNALLEAMALGLPCISADCPCGGPAAVIRSGENGLLFPVGDEKALTAAMVSLLKDGEKRAALAQEARRTAEGFRPEAVFRQWRDYVEAVIAGKEKR